MAYNNVEIEIKVRITKNKFDRIKKYLDKNALFIKSSHHTDTYYNPLKGSFLKPKYPFEWLSIRERDKKSLLNYKHWYPENTRHTTHCDEYETEIGDKKLLENILDAINIKKIITVDKIRYTYTYRQKIEIALDKVKDLGYFLEAESLKNTSGLKKTYNQLKEFIATLGIRKITSVPGGYGAEMMRKKALMKTY